MATDASSYYESAIHDPSGKFEDPESVVGSTALTKAQKLEVLRRWQYDASEGEVATEEGMPGETSSSVASVLRAMHTLGIEPDTEHSPPTKHHSV